MIRRFGWKRQLPDHRDYVKGVTAHIFPPSIDLSFEKFMPAIYNQGDLGSCTAQGIVRALQYDMRKQYGDINALYDFMPSRLFIYYNERRHEHSTAYDSGASIRDGIRTIAREGFCSELCWPYMVHDFTVKPPLLCYTEAEYHKAIEYQAVPQTMQALKSALYEGFPVVFGFSVFTNFMEEDVTRSGVVPMPAGHLEGGHCVTLVGYNDITQQWKVANSWGTEWGLHGYCYMPYAFLLDKNICSDFWTIEKVT